MFKKSLALILLTVLVLTSFVIPAYADSAIGNIGTEEMGPIENDRVPLKDSYTEDELKSILAGDHNFDIPDEGLAFNAENFPLDVDENVVSPNIVDIVEDDYYIAVQETGKILIAPNSTYITTTNYSESEAYMWEFDEVSAYTYAIRNKLNPDTCLAASPSSSGNSAVVKKTYSATDVTCHWSMHVYNSGNVLRSEATGTNAAGQYLYISGNQFVLSTSSRTKIGLIDVDWFIPCTSLSLESYYILSPGKQQYIEVEGSAPANANLLNNSWVTYSIASSNIATINQNGYIAGNNIGTTTVTVTHKLTKATGSAPVYVGYLNNVEIYYDYAFKSLCSSETAFNNSPSIQIEEWFEIIREKYARDLNINLKLISTSIYRTFPEQVDANGSMLCDNGGNPDAECNCSSVCEDSESNNIKNFHHKNLHNILARIPRPNTNLCLRILITGHDACEESDDLAQTCDPSSPYGIAYSTLGCAVIAINHDNDVLPEGMIIKTIAHEIGHFFQDPNPNPGQEYYGLDHYDIGEVPGSNLDEDQEAECIWGEDKNKSEIYGILRTCEGCTDEIKSNANRYNHQ